MTTLEGVMDPATKSLAAEAKAAIARTNRIGSSPRPDTERLRAARARFLPYVVVGSAIACSYLDVVVARKDNLFVLVSASVAAGTLAGMSVGWILSRLFERRVERSSVSRWRGDIAIVLLSAPAYVVAGWTSAWIGWVVADGLGSRSAEPPPNAWGLLIAAGVFVYPLSYAFARRDRDRPRGFKEAVAAAVMEVRGEPRSNLVLGEFLIGLFWFCGALVALFFGIIGFQVAFPLLTVGNDLDPTVLLILVLGVWIGISVWGTLSTIGWIRRRKGRRA